MSENVIALYDCRSKQEYIYRTSVMKEITGGSLLLSGFFEDFFRQCRFKICTDWKGRNVSSDFLEEFDRSGLDAQVLYEGGGNLFLIYKNKRTYLDVNREMSRYALINAVSVYITAACADVTGNFSRDRAKLYEQNAIQKNIGAFYTPLNILPIVQTDRKTNQPIVKKEKDKDFTAESECKIKAYEKAFQKAADDDTFEYELDRMTDKGEKSLLAVIYIDGNNMGKKVKSATAGKDTYPDGINALREFSEKTNEDFVDRPIEKIKEYLDNKREKADERYKHKYRFRQVIGGGDEITLICNAELVPDLLNEYFKTLTEESDNSACAGVAIFHSHAPFADVYKIAEECCESGKSLSHKDDSAMKNYIDFHFCHAGITGDLESIRRSQDGSFTERPYEYSTTWKQFLEIGNMLKEMGRANVKDLADAVVEGMPFYRFELERILSRKKLNIDGKDEKIAHMIYDAAVVYDEWFSKGEENV